MLKKKILKSPEDTSVFIKQMIQKAYKGRVAIMVLTYKHMKISLHFACSFITSVSSILLVSLLVGINTYAWKQMLLKYTFVLCFMGHNHSTGKRTGRTKMTQIPRRKLLRNALR